MGKVWKNKNFCGKLYYDMKIGKRGGLKKTLTYILCNAIL